MLHTSELLDVQRRTDDGRWIPALPVPHSSVWWRLRDAWEVLRGRAQAIREDQ